MVFYKFKEVQYKKCKVNYRAFKHQLHIKKVWLTQVSYWKNIDVWILKETKVGASFPKSQLKIDDYLRSFKYDRYQFGGGVLIYLRDDIPCKELSEHKFPIDIEGYLSKLA